MPSSYWPIHGERERLLRALAAIRDALGDPAGEQPEPDADPRAKTVQCSTATRIDSAASPAPGTGVFINGEPLPPEAVAMLLFHFGIRVAAGARRGPSTSPGCDSSLPSCAPGGSAPQK